jgi:hypothetical protein
VSPRGRLPEGDTAVASDGGTDDGTRVTDLPTTDSGAIKKRDAVRWLESLDEPSSAELQRAITPKRDGFEGRTFPTDVSNVRVTGDAEFVETIAGLFKPFLEMEDYRTRLEINLQETEDKETGEQTGNYALYLSVAERSG